MKPSTGTIRGDRGRGSCAQKYILTRAISPYANFTTNSASTDSLFPFFYLIFLFILTFDGKTIFVVDCEGEAAERTLMVLEETVVGFPVIEPCI